MNIIKGDLIKLAKQGMFDVIAHGCNCFCKQKSGIAKQMVEAFNTDDPMFYTLEHKDHKGDFSKLGNIEWCCKTFNHGLAMDDYEYLYVVNCYTQFKYGTDHVGDTPPLDYTALRMCMKKLNHTFRGRHIGLPKIGCGLAGGNWEVVKSIIEEEVTDCKVTIVEYKK